LLLVSVLATAVAKLTRNGLTRAGEPLFFVVLVVAEANWHPAKFFILD
jgi:hypothetical protein